jgi:siroheme synthase
MPIVIVTALPYARKAEAVARGRTGRPFLFHRWESKKSLCFSKRETRPRVIPGVSASRVYVSLRAFRRLR